MPQLNERNVRHLLRRTEFVDRQTRVDELMRSGSFAAAVDNVLDVRGTPPSVRYAEPEDRNYHRGLELAHFWLDQMAHDSPRPIREKMALFWHGHLVSELGKVGRAHLMQEQIDLYRREGLGDFRSMVKTMSTQVAMLRYLDNNANVADSPNQNFARELMELFLLEVGNYTEADVEAATAAWTGHTDDWRTGEYIWRDGQPKQHWEPMYHDGSTKQFLGRTINAGGDPRRHGDETIDVILGNGVVPSGAAKSQNRGRPTRLVAAEFLSRKLWIDFADQNPPGPVISAMRDALVGADFEVRPWLRTMLLRDEFYTDAVRTGLVRSPIDWMVSMLYATGQRSADGTSMWQMGNTGQEILRPPNVSGWRTNGYYVSASTMEARARMAEHTQWRALQNYWDDGYIQLRNGRLTYAQVTDSSGYPDYTPDMPDEVLVDRMAELMEVSLAPTTRSALIAHIAAGELWQRVDLLFLMLLAPELHVA